MGFGNGGFARKSELVEGDFSERGIETSLSGNPDTDILVFNMSASVNVGVDEDTAIPDPATPVAVGDDEDSTGHTVATAAVAETP